MKRNINNLSLSIDFCTIGDLPLLLFTESLRTEDLSYICMQFKLRNLFVEDHVGPVPFMLT
jgi:hypothetical protein